MINLENFQQKLDNVIHSSEYQKLVDDVTSSKFIFFLGNGGNLAVAAHAATDFGNYIKDKNSRSIESNIKLTSKLNNQSSDIYLESVQDAITNLPTNEITFIIISSSGENKRLVDVVNFLNQKEIKTHQIIGKGQSKDNTISFEIEFYHTGEVLTLALMYDLMERCGAKLKKI
jgi:DNA-binding MurR/RpiR family transcriptional regulator